LRAILASGHRTINVLLISVILT